MMKNDNGLENGMTVRLSGSQQGIYLECIAYPESTMYNLPFLGRFKEAPEPERLKEALLKAISVHQKVVGALDSLGFFTDSDAASRQHI